MRFLHNAGAKGFTEKKVHGLYQVQAYNETFSKHTNGVVAGAGIGLGVVVVGGIVLVLTVPVAVVV